MEKIDSFTSKYRFLSNFYIEPDGTHLEAEYQAAKTLDVEAQNRILGMTPAKAKDAGRKVVLRSDWDAVKISVMRNLLKQKFSNKYLAGLLLDTENAELIEGNYWNDIFWGVCKGVGENNLGKLLMELRDQLKAIE